MAARVLIVDDEPTVRRATAAVLSRDGYEVIVAASPAEVAPGDRFSVGIFDVNLRGGDGVGAARAMLDAGQVDQAIFYTGGADDALYHRAEAVGTVVFKPDIGPLRAEVKRLSSAPPLGPACPSTAQR